MLSHFGGRGEIRTLGAIASSQSFQDCQLNHSCTLPALNLELRISRQKFGRDSSFQIPDSILLRGRRQGAWSPDREYVP